jgi:hypothetical protein
MHESKLTFTWKNIRYDFGNEMLFVNAYINHAWKIFKMHMKKHEIRFLREKTLDTIFWKWCCLFMHTNHAWKDSQAHMKRHQRRFFFERDGFVVCIQIMRESTRNHAYKTHYRCCIFQHFWCIFFKNALQTSFFMCK